MGRKKISITRLTDERNRQITFSKRKAGLLKKAYELSILCDVEIAVIMITSNSKLYQYASSNMNSILIRYTDFKDPDESKTNADILDDITKKDKNTSGQEESGDEETSAPPSNFMLTPRTQENFRRMDKEFDHLLRSNQATIAPPNPQQAATPLGSAPANIPSVMPVTVPVGGVSPGTVQQIQQHLQSQLEGHQKVLHSANLSSASIPSVSSNSTLFSPQSDFSSASPMASARNPRSPSNLPTPLATPTRLQTLRNQTLKLHLPGSGRNYISLSTGSGSGGEASYGKKDGEDMEDNGNEGEDGRSGAKPQLRVFIPGQKEFIPRTEPFPLPQVAVTTQQATLEADRGGGGGERVGGARGGGGAEGSVVPGGGGGSGVAVRKGAGVSICTSVTLSTNTESLTTPVLSLTTPNVFSSIPPIFSSILGDFPFNQTPISTVSGSHVNMSGTVGVAGGGAVGGAGTAGGGGGGGDKDSSSAALVAFPVSIQPSASATGGSNAGNLILQAQNMGQPFLLTPTRQNSLLSSQSFATPPPSSNPLGPGATGIGTGNLEQLKQQYERTQQLIQQQLFYSQMQILQQQQQSKEGGGADGSTASTTSVPSTASAMALGGKSPLLHTMQPPAIHSSLEGDNSDAPGLGHPLQLSSDGGGSARSMPQFINGADVLISSLAVRKPRQIAHALDDSGSSGESLLPPAKKVRIDSSPGPDT